MNNNLKNISRIKDEKNIVRDRTSNAILFQNDESLTKRNNFFRDIKSDINMLREEIKFMQETLESMKTLLEENLGKEEQR
jgi:uncharacterized protein (DUF3084 family)